MVVQLKNPQTVHCGGIPDYYYFRNKMRAFQSSIGSEMVNILMRYHRAAGHFLRIELINLRTKLQRNTDNMDLRVKYLAKEVSEEDLKRKLASRDTSKMKARAILDIYELFNNVMTEGMVHIYNLSAETCREGIMNEIDKITRVRIYCNKELHKVSYIYHQFVRMIKSDMYTESAKFTSLSKFEGIHQPSSQEKNYFVSPYEWKQDHHSLLPFTKKFDELVV